MEYGANILSKQPADWQVVKGSMTSANITLLESGRASIKLVASDIKSIPESMLLYLLVEPFTDTYEPSAYAGLDVVTEDGNVTHYMAPIVDTGNGICSVEIPTTKTSYKALTFYITSAYRLVVYDWSLSAPVADEPEINLDEVKEEIPKLLADYNTATMVVRQQEEVIALISARLIENTDVSGHLQVTFVASEACVVTIRLKDNDGTELFAPILYNVQKGRSSVGVPHAYLKRLLGMHTFTVTAQCSTGTLTFYTRSVMYTIDAGYLAKRTMDVGLDLRDIAICQLPGESAPSSIYAVGIDDDDIARVRFRAYSENAAIVWEPAFSLTAAKKAAIEFDGDFVRRTGDAYYTLECYKQPFVFWVDMSDDLYVQIGPDEDTRLKLASNVSQVAAVRGFKSQLYPEQDQGLIAAYIVDGSVFYRSYCRQADGTFMWEYERAVPQLGSDNVNLQIHRLNDYRVGFVASGPSGHKWAISGRTYVGAAFPAEQIQVSTETAASMAIYKADEGVPEISFMYSVSDDGLVLNILGTLPLFTFEDFYRTFYIHDSSTTSLSVRRMEAVNGYIRIYLNEKIRDGILYLTPYPNRLKAYYANRGYIPIFSTIRFDFGRQQVYTDSVEVQVGLSGKFVQKSVLPTENAARAETLLVTPSMTLQMAQKFISVGHADFTEGFAVHVSMTFSATQLYVGTSPV